MYIPQPNCTFNYFQYNDMCAIGQHPFYGDQADSFNRRDDVSAGMYSCIHG